MGDGPLVDDGTTSRMVSVVVPVFNEEEVIPEFYSRLSAVANDNSSFQWEIVFVDDGSSDESLSQLRKLADQDQRVKVIQLSRNFGHQIAITAGLDHAQGDAVVLIDADLQDPPEVIPRMIGRWREGCDVVYGVRASREGETRFKLVTARVFYRLLNRISDTRLPFDAGDFRLLDRRVVTPLREAREENRYLRGLVSWMGFRQCSIEYERERRFAGSTKYSLTKMLRFAGDAVTSFSERPLRLAMQLGSLVTLGAAIFTVWIIAGRLLEPERSFPGWASLMVAVLFLGGVQLLSIGLLGEYVGRIYRETKRRPLYVVSDTINLDNLPESYA